PAPEGADDAAGRTAAADAAADAAGTGASRSVLGAAAPATARSWVVEAAAAGPPTVGADAPDPSENVPMETLLIKSPAIPNVANATPSGLVSGVAPDTGT